MSHLHLVNPNCIFCGSKAGFIYHISFMNKSAHLSCLLVEYDKNPKNKRILFMLKALNVTPTKKPGQIQDTVTSKE